MVGRGRGRRPRRVLQQVSETEEAAPETTEPKGPRRSTRKKPQAKESSVELEDLDPVEDDDELGPQIILDPPPRRGSRKTKKSATATVKTPAEPPLASSTHINVPDVTQLEYLEINLGGEEAAPSSSEEGDTGGKFQSSSKAGSGNRTARLDRALRVAARHVHLMCLFEAYRRKSRFLATPSLRAELLSQVPPHLLRQFSPEILLDGRTIVNALSMLSSWWKNTVRLRMGRGSVPPTEPSSHLPVQWLPERRQDAWLRSVATSKEGNAEDLVALFTCIVQALGLQARYICSLQPIPIRNDDATASSELPQSSPSDPPGEGGPEGRAKGAPPLKTPPAFWTEIYHPVENKWIPVDCLRGIVNDRLSMEPPIASRTRTQHLFIIGFDPRGRAVDVTRRYSTKYFGVAAKLRRYDALVLQLLLAHQPSLSDAEETELASLVDGEAIPSTLAGFHGHGRYMLESQLKKYEVFWPPDAGIVGEFRGQPVRLRSVVQKVRSKESWYTQFGRVIKEGESPCKQVKLPKKPEKIGKKKAEDWERILKPALTEGGAKETIMQPLYGEWQTEPFSPPIAADGQVPRNKFGNVDLYLPSMLPVGCVWIDDDSAYLAAKDLGVDYAAACVRFAFSGRIAMPNLQGIVICAEFEGAVRRRLEEMRVEIIQAKLDAEAEKAAKRARLEGRKAKIMRQLIEEHDLDVEDDDRSTVKIVSTLAEGGRDGSGEDLEDLF